MSNNKQDHIGDTNKMVTAVEWLEDNLIGNPFSEKDFEHNRNVFRKAKAMEREQIIEANRQGRCNDCPIMYLNEEAQQYYNQNFNQNK